MTQRDQQPALSPVWSPPTYFVVILIVSFYCCHVFGLLLTEESQINWKKKHQVLMWMTGMSILEKCSSAADTVWNRLHTKTWNSHVIVTTLTIDCWFPSFPLRLLLLLFPPHLHPSSPLSTPLQWQKCNSTAQCARVCVSSKPTM